jgi:hypothetical protein
MGRSANKIGGTSRIGPVAPRWFIEEGTKVPTGHRRNTSGTLKSSERMV